ncbi:MAG: nitronate monooxygenase [Bacteroidales bacterium]|nr:nitronate monooxygenase [Bacteroidales bacterium]
MLKSAICDILGIEKPVFQGGMAWIADAQLAAAVSEAGGLGLISSINYGTEAVREEIRKARELTGKPFGVNIMLAAPNAAEVAALVVEEGVDIVTTGAGSPAPYMEAWKAAGIRVIPVVASVAYARKMQELGATAVIAEGAESGGHVGELHTMALVPQVVDAVNLPVLAAGGIFDGRGAAAAFMLGACGVQVGTRFLMARECHIHPVYKERLIKASDIGTMVTGKSLGDAVRGLKTPFTKKFAAMEADPAVSADEIRAFGTGSLRKAVFDGDLAGGSFLAGEVAGLITHEESAAEIVDDIMTGAEDLLKQAQNHVFIPLHHNDSSHSERSDKSPFPEGRDLGMG